MPDTMETLRAAVEIAFPGGDGVAAGLDVRADIHIRDALEGFLPGSLDLLAALLDAQAAGAGATDGFAALPPVERAAVFRSMLSEEIADVRELAEAVLLFGAGAVFSEWSGYDRATRTLRPPPVWERIGFGGPSIGHPSYRAERS
ncbi:MAG: hypothetical protein ABR548_01330 [Actinomycetota bacterium]|nr:hypothetical protein [Actinomycetota bacterium]